MRRSSTPLISSLFCAALAAQEGVPQPAGLVPEQMWYAPSAEDWQKPPLIRWQRTWDDAVRLSQQTKKPILVCVNMDDCTCPFPGLASFCCTTLSTGSSLSAKRAR